MDINNLYDIINEARQKKTSDIHFTVGLPTVFRIHGSLTPCEIPLTDSDISDLILSMLNKEQKELLESGEDLDFAIQSPDGSRCRVNVFRAQGQLGAVLRLLNTNAPSLDQMGLPSVLKTLVNEPRGLILVTGPTGSGKSTTLAAMLNYINERYETNIVTVEDPIEFLHTHKKSTIRQREIGTDTKSFANALRTVLRHDPDTIMIGEMRDPESIQIAVTAAETGHLVFSTLHTQTAPLTISRIIDSFPSEQKAQIRSQLANSLKAVISQQLIPTINGKGRVAAVEYMVDTPAIKNLIREEKEHQLYATMQTGQMQGMQTMDQALLNLLKQQKISKDSVVEFCVDQKEVLRLMATMGY